MFSTPRGRRIVFVLWLLVFVSGTQSLVVSPLIPRIAEQLSVAEGGLGVLVTAYAVSVGVFALVAGPVSDRIGRRKILLAGTGLLAISLALHGLVWNVNSLLAVRALAGVAGGILNGASVAYVGDYFPPEERGAANGWVFSGIAAGQIAGVPIGALLASRFGFRVPFLLFGGFMLLTVILVYRVVPQPDVELADSLSVRSALQSYAGLLARRDVKAAVVVFLVMFGGNALYTTFLPAWLEGSLGLGAGAVAVMFAVGGVANVLAGPQAGTLSDRVGRKPVIVWASLSLAVLMGVTTTLMNGALTVYAVFFAVMGLFAARATPFQTLLTELVAGDKRGSLMSLTVGIGQFGSGVGGALAGVGYAAVGYTGTTLVAGSAMVVIGVLVWVFFPETGTTDGDDSTPAPVASD